MLSLLPKVRYVLQRKAKGHKVRDFITKSVARLLPKNDLKLSPEAASIHAELDEVGFAPLPNLFSEEQIAEILAYFDGFDEVHNQYDPKKVKFKKSSPPDNVHTGTYSDREMVNCPHLIEAANDPTILSVVSEAFGFKPTFSKIAVWHSYANNEQATNSENYHRDVDDVTFLKVFVYLSDVDKNGGPHVFVVGSHKDNRFLDVRRYSDEEIEPVFGDKVVTITGKTGDTFIENTYGLHKGLVARNQNRMILQFEYSAYPIGAYQYTEKRETSMDVDKYINRLYVA